MKKYIFRLAIFAIISQIPFMLFHSIISESFSLNVIFTLLFGLIAILVYDKYNKFTGFATAFALGTIAEILNCDYGIYGVFVTFFFYVFNKSKLLTFISFIILTITKYGYNIIDFCIKNGTKYFKLAFNYYWPYAICTIVSIIFVLLYNKKKGANTKYLLYLFYPLHLLLLYGITVLQS